jgi:hypothetical protein
MAGDLGGDYGIGPCATDSHLPQSLEGYSILEQRL